MPPAKATRWHSDLGAGGAGGLATVGATVKKAGWSLLRGGDTGLLSQAVVLVEVGRTARASAAGHQPIPLERKQEECSRHSQPSSEIPEPDALTIRMFAGQDMQRQPWRLSAPVWRLSRVGHAGRRCDGLLVIWARAVRWEWHAI